MSASLCFIVCIYLWMFTQDNLLNSNKLLSTRFLHSLPNTYKLTYGIDWLAFFTTEHLTRGSNSIDSKLNALPLGHEYILFNIKGVHSFLFSYFNIIIKQSPYSVDKTEYHSIRRNYNILFQMGWANDKWFELPYYTQLSLKFTFFCFFY